MTGNVTDLATSKRLAKAGWKDGAEQWWCGEGEAAIIADLPMEAIDGKTVAPARDLSELEAKMAEMGLEWHATCRVGTVWVTAWEKEATDALACAKTEHFINALGKALAVALEAAAKEKP